MFYIYNTSVELKHKVGCRPVGVIETHISLGATLHALEVLNSHNQRNGHTERYAYTEGGI